VTQQATATVSGANPAAVSPMFFGENYWSWPVAYGDPVAAVQTQTTQLGLNILRAGGSNNDTQSPEPFSLTDIDTYVAYARAAGAEPLLQVPVIKNLTGTTPTAQDAADLVTYVNKTKSYGIKYFSIGNEPDLYISQSLQGASYDALAYCTTFSSFVAAMKAVDPTILVMGPELSWMYQSGTNDWLTPFLQNCGSVVDIVSVHRYPFAPAACTAAAAYSDAASFQQTIQHLQSILAATGQASKPLAITEANITYDGTPALSTLPASPGTFPAGLWVADSLGIGLQQGLFSLAYWSLSEGWTLGFLNGTTPRPAYYALQLYSSSFGNQVLSVSGAPSGVSVYAGRNTKKAVSSVFVVNKTPNRVVLTLTLQGLPRTDAPVLTADPMSLLVAELPDDGSAPKVTEYSSGMAKPTAWTN
jgi:hypothetical protein